MDLRRTSLLLALMTLTLTGCFRQADVPLATVESQQIIISPEPLQPDAETDASEADSGDNDIVIIDPDAIPTQTEAPPTATVEDLSALSNNDPDDVEIIDPNAPTSEPSTETPVPTTSSLPSPVSPDTQTLATATEITIITPAAPGVQVPLEEATPTATPPSADDDAQVEADEEDEDEDTEPLTISSDCTYTIQSGDTLFRIALNNGVTLAALLAENNLGENAIIQPGQLLRLPDCEGGVIQPTATTAPDDTATVDDSDAGEQTIHTVASGETLGGIARRYGVTIAQIVAANSLSNPDQLSIGQRLVIPSN